MANVKRWAIRDAGIATFYALTDITNGAKAGEPIVTLPSLKTSGVETTGETVYARGGRGNSKLVGFSSNREAKITFENALFDNEALGMLTGNIVTEGVENVEVQHFYNVVTPGSETVTPSATPVAGTQASAFLYVDGMKDGEELQATVNGSDIDIDTTGLSAGDTIIIYYVAATDAFSSTVNVTTDAFGGTFKVVLDLLVTDSVSKADYAAQLVIPNAKFEDNFNLDLSADGDPATLNLNLEILKDPNSTDMWKLIIFDDETLS